jgi:hypothetical protein
MTRVFILSIVVFMMATPLTAQSPGAAEVITLQRTVCFGTCPAYKLTIFHDGRVVYVGSEFVKNKGTATARISVADLENLVSEFTKLDYFSLKGDLPCPENWTDNPSAITSLSWGGKKNAVNHYYGCHGAEILEKLTKLESKIDEVVNTNQWVK